jgi:hypothetical protein
MVAALPASYMIDLVKQAMATHTLPVFLFHSVGGGHAINEGRAEPLRRNPYRLPFTSFKTLRNNSAESIPISVARRLMSDMVSREGSRSRFDSVL